EFMEPFVEIVKIQLNPANNVIDDDLITINAADHRVEFTYLRAHGLLTFFETLLARLQLTDVIDNFMPNGAGIVESLIYRFFKAIYLFLDPLKSRVHFLNSREDGVTIIS